MPYLHMLVKQGQSDKAISEARQYLHGPEYIHALARTLIDNDEIEQAFQLAQHGLTLDDVRGKDALAEWLRRRRDMLLSAGEIEMWTTYIDQIMDKHPRKYKLMPMLQELCTR
jgi:uncharacterized Zn finger protein